MKDLIYASPFLVAVFTVTSLYAANAERLNPGQMIAPLIFSLIIAGIFLLLFWLLRWTSRSAPFLAAVFTGCFLLWNTGPWWIFVIIMVAVLAAGIRGQEKINRITTVLISGITALGILATMIQGLVVHNMSQVDLDRISNPFQAVQYGQQNIYFLVPDRMPSPDALRESGIDPDAMVQDLRDLGFYVPEDLISADPYTPDYPDEVNTTRTMRFLAAVLNDGEAVPMDISYKDCRMMIRDPGIFTRLHDQGYWIVNVASWFNETSFFPTADLNMTFEDVSLLERLFRNELSATYFERTILAGLNFRLLQSQASIESVETARHEWTKTTLGDLAADGGSSRFTFAHMMLPHEPFIYTQAESPQDQYYDQIRWTMTYLVDLAGSIRVHDPTAIIIIQSDEGMAYRKPRELNDNLSLVQWSGVFAAWYIGDLDINLSSAVHTDILDLVLTEKE